jgi:hypothetical protein
MHRNSSRRRSAARLLSLAAVAGLGLHFLDPDDKQGGGGGGANPSAEPPKEEKKGEQQSKKLELTPEELARHVDDAVAKVRADLAAERDAEKKRAEEEEARKRGEFEKLYQGEATRVKELEAKLAETNLRAKRGDVANRLARHLAANHKDYVENDVDILPHVQFDADTPDDEVDKRVKAATDAFVKRTPKASHVMGAPAGAARGKLPDGSNPPPPRGDDGRQPITRPVGPAARF